MSEMKIPKDLRRRYETLLTIEDRDRYMTAAEETEFSLIRRIALAEQKLEQAEKRCEQLGNNLLGIGGD